MTAQPMPTPAQHTPPAFTLHPQLAKDGLMVGDLPLCRILLMNNRSFPWLVLVPRQPQLRELVDMNVVDLHRLTDEIALASRVVQEIVSPDKLNIASLGNKVDQLHIHIIGRLTNDAAWPEPVWGKSGEPYRGNEAMQILQMLRASFASKESSFHSLS